MENPTILVIDGDAKNLQILRESLEASGFTVLTCSNGNDAWDVIHSQNLDIILSEIDLPGLNGLQLLRKLQEDPVGATIPLIFLTNRRDLEDRIKSLRVGVKDYMIKPLHVKEVIARVQMILKRISRVKNEEGDSSKKVLGRLEETTVEELIEKFGVDKSTGVLNLYDHNNRSGDIYFREGAVVNATLGNFKAEKAVYQMMPWKKGHYIMTFKDINVADEISISNLGLLLQGFKRIQERNKLITKIPALETVLVKTHIFQQIIKKRSVSTDALKFISLFDGKRAISDIITDSNYDDLKTLERIVKLYQQGFVQEKIMPEKTELEESPEAIERELEKQAETEEIQEPEKTRTEAQVDEELEEASVPESLEDEIEVEESPVSSEEEPTDVETESTTPPDLDYVARSARSKEPQVPVDEPKQEEEASELHAVNNGQSQTEHYRSEDISLRQNGLMPIFQNLLRQSGSKEGHLVVISDSKDGRRQLISKLTNDQYTTKSIDSDGASLEFAKVEVATDLTINIIGLSSERKFLHLLEQLSSPLIGYIVIVSDDNYAKLGYIGYLINYLKLHLRANYIVAVCRGEDKRKMSLEFIRNSLRLEESEQLIEFEPCQNESIKHLISQLIPPASTSGTLIHSKRFIQVPETP